MLTDKEKAIAREVAAEYTRSGMTLADSYSLFLSRIREEQEAVAWRYIDCSDEGTCCHMYNEMRQGEPLFTTPPAAPDCSELVEALKPFANFACSTEGACECFNCKARDAIANHAKRMKGEE